MAPVHKRFSDLPESHQSLVRRMQEINFGFIENLMVESRNPYVGECTKITHRIKLGGDNNSRSEVNLEDFALSQQVIELLEMIHAIEDGVIQRIDVQHGLPVQVLVES